MLHYVLQGLTALHYAACNDKRHLCKLLISYGADKTAETMDVSRVLSASMLCYGHATALYLYGCLIASRPSLISLIPVALSVAGIHPLRASLRHQPWHGERSRHSISLAISKTAHSLCCHTWAVYNMRSSAVSMSKSLAGGGQL